VGALDVVMAKKFNWLIHKLANDSIRRAIKQYASGSLIDVGCGTSQYKGFILRNSSVVEYVALDREKRAEIDILGDAYNIPRHGEFDTVLCTSVLEHLEEPVLALEEMNKALRPGGHIILTTNFIWHIHEEPRDFFRYTEYGLRYILERSGYEIVDLEPITGFWVTFGQEFCYYINKFNHYSLLKPFVYILSRFVLFVSLFLESIDKDVSFSSTYIVVAKKKFYGD